MLNEYLPEVVGTVQGALSSDRGNLFDRAGFFPKKAEKKLEAQKEVFLRMLEFKEKTELARIEAETELAKEQLRMRQANEEMKYKALVYGAELIRELNGISAEERNYVIDQIRDYSQAVNDLFR